MYSNFDHLVKLTNKNKTAFIDNGHFAFPQIQMNREPEGRSNISVHWFSQQHAGKQVGWYQKAMIHYLSTTNKAVSFCPTAWVFHCGYRPTEVHAVSQPHVFPAHGYHMYLTTRKCLWHNKFNQRVDSLPGGLREQNRLTSHHSGQWDWWGKTLVALLPFSLQIIDLVTNVGISSKTSMLCLNVFQIVVLVKVQGEAEQYQREKDLLPVRDFGVDTRLLHAFDSEFTVNIGPLCFLWRTQCVCVCMHACVCMCACVSVFVTL